ncbi:hypothetical protein RUND412_006686 [Rhizina undulata]
MSGLRFPEDQPLRRNMTPYSRQQQFAGSGVPNPSGHRQIQLRAFPNDEASVQAYPEFVQYIHVPHHEYPLPTSPIFHPNLDFSNDQTHQTASHIQLPPPHEYTSHSNIFAQQPSNHHLNSNGNSFGNYQKNETNILGSQVPGISGKEGSGMGSNNPIQFNPTNSTPQLPHTQIHVDPHKCRICNITYSDREKYRRHELEKHGKRFKCIVPGCPHSYPRTQHLKEHIRRHHRGVPVPDKFFRG